MIALVLWELRIILWKNHIFREKNNVRDALDNDVDAILSRIVYIQNREPSSMYVLAFLMNDL